MGFAYLGATIASRLHLLFYDNHYLLNCAGEPDRYTLVIVADTPDGGQEVHERIFSLVRNFPYGFEVDPDEPV